MNAVFSREARTICIASDCAIGRACAVFPFNIASAHAISRAYTRPIGFASIHAVWGTFAFAGLIHAILAVTGHKTGTIFAATKCAIFGANTRAILIAAVGAKLGAQTCAVSAASIHAILRTGDQACTILITALAIHRASAFPTFIAAIHTVIRTCNRDRGTEFAIFPLLHDCILIICFADAELIADSLVFGTPDPAELRAILVIRALTIFIRAIPGIQRKNIVAVAGIQIVFAAYALFHLNIRPILAPVSIAMDIVLLAGISGNTKRCKTKSKFN